MFLWITEENRSSSILQCSSHLGLAALSIFNLQSGTVLHKWAGLSPSDGHRPVMMELCRVPTLSVCFVISVSAAGERGQVARGDGAAVNLQQQTAQRGTDHFLLHATR